MYILIIKHGGGGFLYIGVEPLHGYIIVDMGLKINCMYRLLKCVFTYLITPPLETTSSTYTVPFQFCYGKLCE